MPKYDRTNRDRADRALAALATYCEPDGQDRTEILRHSDLANPELRQDTFDEVVSDLMGDLMHLADTLAVSVDWRALADRGEYHHQQEALDERQPAARPVSGRPAAVGGGSRVDAAAVATARLSAVESRAQPPAPAGPALG